MKNNNKIKILDNYNIEFQEITNITNITKGIIAYLPIIISKIIIKICILANIKLPESASAVTEIKNNLIIKECKYIMDDNIYIDGFIRKRIYYSHFNDYKYYKIDIPFEIFTGIKDFDDKVINFKKNFDSLTEIKGEWVSESISNINNPPYFEILSDKITENVKLIFKSDDESTEGNITDVDSKMVINIKFDMLKNENVYILSVKDYEKEFVDSSSKENIINIEFGAINSEEELIYNEEELNKDETERINVNVEDTDGKIKIKDEIINEEKVKEYKSIIEENKDNTESDDYNYQIIDQKMKRSRKIETIYTYEEKEIDELQDNYYKQFQVIDQSMKNKLSKNSKKETHEKINKSNRDKKNISESKIKDIEGAKSKNKDMEENVINKKEVKSNRIWVIQIVSPS